MANGELCKRCNYQESEHKYPFILDNDNLSAEEFWKKHKKLRDCLFPKNRSTYGFISDQNADPESGCIILEVKKDSESISVTFVPGS